MISIVLLILNLITDHKLQIITELEKEFFHLTALVSTAERTGISVTVAAIIREQTMSSKRFSGLIGRKFEKIITESQLIEVTFDDHISEFNRGTKLNRTFISCIERCLLLSINDKYLNSSKCCFIIGFFEFFII